MNCSFSHAIGDIFMWFFPKLIENHTIHPIPITKKYCRTALPYYIAISLSHTRKSRFLYPRFQNGKSPLYKSKTVVWSALASTRRSRKSFGKRFNIGHTAHITLSAFFTQEKYFLFVFFGVCRCFYAVFFCKLLKLQWPIRFCRVKFTPSVL